MKTSGDAKNDAAVEPHVAAYGGAPIALGRTLKLLARILAWFAKNRYAPTVAAYITIYAAIYWFVLRSFRDRFIVLAVLLGGDMMERAWRHAYRNRSGRHRMVCLVTMYACDTIYALVLYALVVLFTNSYLSGRTLVLFGIGLVIQQVIYRFSRKRYFQITPYIREDLARDASANSGDNIAAR